VSLSRFASEQNGHVKVDVFFWVFTVWSTYCSGTTFCCNC